MSEDLLDQALLERFSDASCWVVAVSGGSDSMALMYSLHEWVRSRAVMPKILIAHVNHCTGLTSYFAADFVRARARELGFEYISITWDRIDLQANSYLSHQNKGSNFHNAARVFRYKFFVDLCKSHTSSFVPNCIFTAHNMQDNAETVLMNIERGSGIDGLCGISEINTVKDCVLVRPMLSSSKSSIRGYLSSRNLPWIEDPANYNQKFRRAFYRNKILPLFGLRYQHRIKKMTHNLQAVKSALNYYADLEYARCVNGDEMDVDIFRGLPQDIQRRVLARYIWPSKPRGLNNAIKMLIDGVNVRIGGWLLCFTKSCCCERKRNNRRALADSSNLIH